MKKLLVVMMLALVAGLGCDHLCDCYDDQKKELKKYGEPDRKTEFRGETFKSDTWYYDTRTVDFTWGYADDCDCHKSVSTYSSKVIGSSDSVSVTTTKELTRHADCAVCP